MKSKYGMTVVVVTSDVRQAYQIADRIGFLYRGKMVAIGSPEAIRKSDHPVVNQFIHGLLEGPLTPEGSSGDRI
jgi:phospholipid/cholesterol/gamma-HCH transport system ATP-binding protein